MSETTQEPVLDGGTMAPDKPELVHMRAAVVEDGVVMNLIVVEATPEGRTDFDLPGARILTIRDDSEVGLNWTYAGGRFSPPEIETEE